MRIAVIDGQGGGIGKAIIEELRNALGDEIEIVALGTNSLATALMIKAGADNGATGENAVVFNVMKVDVIIGPIGIIAADSMLGELTPKMAVAIAKSPAQKVLIPLDKCHIQVAGVKRDSIPGHICSGVEIIKSLYNKDS